MSIGSRPNRAGALSTYVISITPFDAEDQLDERALRTHLARMAAAGVGVYVGGGGSGEGYTLTPTETQRVLEIAAEELRGAVPVRAMGVEPRQATDTIALARTAEQAGIEALQLYSLDTGHGRLPRPDELETYFTDILDAITIPAVLSTHQSVGYFVDLATIGRLLDRFPHLIGVNCTNPDLTYLSRLVDVVDGRADIHVGGPVQALSALALGAQGYLVSEANLAPRLCAAVTDCWARGDLDGAAARSVTSSASSPWCRPTVA